MKRIETTQRTFGKKTVSLVKKTLKTVSRMKKYGSPMHQLINFYDAKGNHIGYWSNGTKNPCITIF